MSKTYTMWTLTNSHGKVVEWDDIRYPVVLAYDRHEAVELRSKGERVTKVKVTVKKVKPHD